MLIQVVWDQLYFLADGIWTNISGSALPLGIQKAALCREGGKEQSLTLTLFHSVWKTFTQHVWRIREQGENYSITWLLTRRDEKVEVAEEWVFKIFCKVKQEKDRLRATEGAQTTCQWWQLCARLDHAASNPGSQNRNKTSVIQSNCLNCWATG